MLEETPLIRQMKGLDNLASKLINQASKEIDKIAEARKRQVINSGRQQIQKIALQIIGRDIEDVYKTSFRLLGKLGKQNFHSLNENCQKYFNKNDRWKNYGQNLSRLCYTLLNWRKKISRF